MSQLKGKTVHISENVVWGLLPQKEIQQADIDTTMRHNLWTSGLTGRGRAGISIHDDKCFVVPNFKLDWFYLIINGVESTYSYELINSVAVDKWFKIIKSETLKY